MGERGRGRRMLADPQIAPDLRALDPLPNSAGYGRRVFGTVDSFMLSIGVALRVVPFDLELRQIARALGGSASLQGLRLTCEFRQPNAHVRLELVPRHPELFAIQLRTVLLRECESIRRIVGFVQHATGPLHVNSLPQRQ